VQSTHPPATTSDTPLLCPHCGYDLRAASTDICPECGQTIDRFTLAQSAFPWAHRRYIGRIRAFVKTVWLITIDSRRLRDESQKPHELSDARSFRNIVALALGLTFLSVFIAITLQQKSLAFLAIQKSNHFDMSENRISHPLYDVLVPWSAGATIWPVMHILLIIFAFALCRVPRFLFRSGDAPSAAALACYSIAPISWLLPITFLELLLVYLDSRGLQISVAINYMMVALPAIVLFATVGRVCQWSVRARKPGRLGAIRVPFQLFVLWLLSLVLWLVLIPWCIGFTWIVIDSFR
jgi:hypothetical protein